MSNVELRVNEFKQVSRNLFKNFCTQYALIEVDIPKGEFSNPYKIRFENDRIFYIIESISYGSRASISFGKLGADYKYGIHNALCVVESRESADKFNDNIPCGGYEKGLKYAIKYLDTYSDFFSKGFLDSIEEL